jgi:hypothetical protein
VYDGERGEYFGKVERVFNRRYAAVRPYGVAAEATVQFTYRATPCAGERRKASMTELTEMRDPITPDRQTTEEKAKE